MPVLGGDPPFGIVRHGRAHGHPMPPRGQVLGPPGAEDSNAGLLWPVVDADNVDAHISVPASAGGALTDLAVVCLQRGAGW
jgi:hypothetical protein